MEDRRFDEERVAACLPCDGACERVRKPLSDEPLTDSPFIKRGNLNHVDPGNVGTQSSYRKGPIRGIGRECDSEIDVRRQSFREVAQESPIIVAEPLPLIECKGNSRSFSKRPCRFGLGAKDFSSERIARLRSLGR